MRKQAAGEKARSRFISLRRIAGIACLILLLAGLGILGNRFRAALQHRDTKAALQELYGNAAAQAQSVGAGAENTSNAGSSSADTRHSSDETEPDGEEGADAPILQEDFEELYQINEDLVGWLEFGKEISLPVVYRDNEFYLNHDYYGKPDNAGAVFINEANTIWPADKNLLFHGHNMHDGASFGDMDDYRSLEYLKEFPLVRFRTIYDPEPVCYVPFALFDASMNSADSSYFDIGWISFEDDEEFRAYTQGAMERSMYAMAVDVAPDDQLITLITCSYHNDNGRFMMLCRALRQDETVEAMAGLLQSAEAR